MIFLIFQGFQNWSYLKFIYSCIPEWSEYTFLYTWVHFLTHMPIPLSKGFLIYRLSKKSFPLQFEFK